MSAFGELQSFDRLVPWFRPLSQPAYPTALDLNLPPSLPQK
jgi:hypothetical protein